MIELQNMGTTYSVVDPTIYDRFKSDGDAEIFENLVMDLMLNKYSEDKELTEYILGLPKTKQRMAVLSVIDGDNVLWSKMNAYVNECSDKFEHIKDVVKIINKFVKDGEVEKKKFGEVMTPITLVREMLDTLPEDVWSNPNLKWLDPANGAGTFPFVVIYKLMNGLKDWEPDTEKRYKHIVEKMIYVCELQSRNVFLWLCGVDPKDEYTTNTYWGSFLEPGFDKHMKEVWGVDKFDIVIGNPPYQEELITKKGSARPLYNIFTEKSIKISTVVMFITPSRWFAGGKGLDDFRKMMMVSGKIKIIKHFDNASDIFSGVEIKGGVSYFIFDKEYNGSTSFNGYYIDIRRYDIIPTSIDPVGFSLIDKFVKFKSISTICVGQSYSGVSSNDIRLKNQKSGIDDILCYVSLNKGLKKYIKISELKENIKGIEKWKVFTARSSTKGGSGFGKYFYIGKPNEICNQSYIVFIVNSEDEAISLKSYLSTKFVNKMLSLRKITQDSKPDTCRWIPIVPLDRTWSDDDIFKYFELNNDQINLINNFNI